MVFSSQFSINTQTGLTANCLFICMELSFFESAGLHTGGLGGAHNESEDYGRESERKQALKQKFTANISYCVKPLVPAALRVAVSAM